jgi:hypothetical protein
VPPGGRLAWLTGQLTDLIQEMRGDAAAIRRNPRETPQARAVAAELLALAERIEGTLGAAVPMTATDHLAAIRWHCAELSALARAARASRAGT